MSKEPCFVEITNRDIYTMLKKIDNKLNKVRRISAWHSWAIGFMSLILASIITAILSL